MKLFGILSYYDESPTWLAACVTSLKRIGVDHLIAVDGSYFHFEGDARSDCVQSEAIVLAAEAIDIGLTLYKPSEQLSSEVQKRNLCFKLLQAHAEPFEDWVFIIDADEVIREGAPWIRQELEDATADVACATIWESFDPDTEEGKNNTPKTMEIYHRIPNPLQFQEFQSRYFRVMNNMRVVKNHWTYLAENARGETVSLRAVTTVDGIRPAGMFTPTVRTVVEHRDWWRTAHRREQKREYYSLRDELGLEE